MNYEPGYKEILDKTMQRDVSVKEKEEGIYKTKKDIRNLVSEWKKRNSIRDNKIFEEIKNDKSASEEYKNFFETFNQKHPTVHLNLDQQHLHTLPSCSIYLKNKTGEYQQLEQVIDSASSHYCIPLHLFQKLGYDKKDIMTSKNFTLFTACKEDKDIILGTFKTKVYFYYKNDYYYFPVDAIILNSSINYSLMDICSLRFCNFQLSHQQNYDKLKLKLRNVKTNQKSFIECSLKCNNIIQCQNLIIHDQEIREKVEPDQLIMNEDLEQQITSSSTDISDIVFERNKVIEESDPNLLKENIDNCTEEEQKQLKILFKKYEKIFARHRYSCGDFSGFEASIEAIPGRQTKQKARKHPPHQIAAVEEVINNCLKYGILEPCHHPEPWENNILIQPKSEFKQNSKADVHVRKLQNFRSNQQLQTNTNHTKPETNWRLLNDFKLSNSNCKDLSKIQLPTFQDIHLKSQNKIISKYDLKNSFYHITIKESHRHRTSFMWKNQRLQYRKLLQGYKGSPNLAKKMLDMVFSRETIEIYLKQNNLELDIDKFLSNLILYSDDFLHFSDSYETHIRDIEIIFFCCFHWDLHLNISKCQFYLKQFVFLGSHFDVERQETSILPARKQAMLNWPTPSNTMELHSRLCQLSYNSIYLCGLRQVAYPLYYLCTVEFYWDDFINKTWNNVLMLIKLSISLTLFDVNKITLLCCDSSTHCYSFNLIQYNKTTKGLDLVDTQTRLHNKAHKNRLIIQKEIFAIAKCLEFHELNIRAARAPCYILTDSITLQFIKDNLNLNNNLYNFSLLLADYDSVALLCLPSHCNFFADMQSRIFTRQYPKIMGEAAQYLNENFFKDEMIISNEQIIDYLFTPTTTSIDCNPKLKRSDFKAQKPYDRIVQLFQEPNELQFLKSASNNLDLIQKDHKIWQTFKANKPINQSDLISITKKYKLNDIDLQAFVMMNKIKNSNQLMAFQEEILQFIIEVSKLLKIQPIHKKMVKQLEHFSDLNENEQFLLLQKLDYYLQSEFNFNIKDLSSFVHIVPYYTESEHFEIRQSETGLQLHFKEDKTVPKGKLLLLPLDLLFFSKSNCLFLEPSPEMKKCIYSSPFSTNKPWHYFTSFYIFFPQRMEIKRDDYLFLIKGFQNEFTFYFPQKPKLFNINNEVSDQIQNGSYNKNYYIQHSPCEENCSNVMVGKQIKTIQTVPIKIKKTGLIDSYRQVKKPIITHLTELLDTHVNILKNREENSEFDKSELIQTLLTDIKQENQKENNKTNRTSFNHNKINPNIINSLLFLQNLLNLDGKLDNKEMIKIQLSSTEGQKYYILGQNNQNNFCIFEKILYKMGACNITGKTFYQLYIPNNIAEILLSFLHHNLYLHVSKEEILRIFNRSFFTENSPKLASKISNSCLTCQVTKSVKISKHIGEQREIKPTQPNMVHVSDVMASLPLTQNNNAHILLILDPFTNFCIARPLQTLSAEETLEKYQEVCSIIGYPLYFFSDYGSNYRNVFSEYLKSVLVYHYKKTATRSQEQGSGEAGIKHLRSFITKAILQSNQDNRQSWDKFLNKLIISFNSQSYYKSKISRINLQFGTSYYNNLSCNFLDTETDENLNYLNKIFEKKCKLQRSKMAKNRIFPGTLVCKLIRNSDQRQLFSSKYLHPTSSNIFLVLYSNHMTLKVKNLNTGHISTCDAAFCRPLTLSEISTFNKFLSPKFPNIFDANRFVRGSGSTYLELPTPDPTIEEATLVEIDSETPKSDIPEDKSETDTKETDNNSENDTKESETKVVKQSPLTIKYPNEPQEIKDLKTAKFSKNKKVKKKARSEEKKVTFNEKVKVRQHLTKWSRKFKEFDIDIKDEVNNVEVNYLMTCLIPHDVSLIEMCLTKDRIDFIVNTQVNN